MAEKRKVIKEKLVRKYRLVVLTEQSYEEKFSFKLTRLNVFVFGGIFSILLITLTSLLIIYTPLKEYIPGFESPNLKRNMIFLNTKLDSIEQNMHTLELYTESLKPTLIGEKAIEFSELPYTTKQGESVYQSGITNNDSIHTKLDKLYGLLEEKNSTIQQLRQKFKEVKIDSLVALQEIDSIINNSNRTNIVVQNTNNTLESSEQDSLFRAKVEQEERFSIFGHQNSKIDLSFIAPVTGDITEYFNIADKHFAIDIATELNAPVKAVADGVVVFSEWSFSTGHVVILLHNYNYVSVYKHNNAINVSQGQLVQGGQVIANAGSTGKLTTGPHLHFEIWKDGYPVDPTNFMKF